MVCQGILVHFVVSKYPKIEERALCQKQLPQQSKRTLPEPSLKRRECEDVLEQRNPPKAGFYASNDNNYCSDPKQAVVWC